MEPKPPSTNPSEVQCTIPIGYFDQKIKTHPEIRKIPVQTFFLKKAVSIPSIIKAGLA
jgi:hypothetical protein